MPGAFDSVSAIALMLQPSFSCQQANAAWTFPSQNQGRSTTWTLRLVVAPWHYGWPLRCRYSEVVADLMDYVKHLKNALPAS